MQEGLIVKALSGFCYVKTESGLLTCKIRGRLRKEGVTPLVGDRVEVQNNMVEQVLPRRNVFVGRPLPMWICWLFLPPM